MGRRYVKFYEDWFDVFEALNKEPFCENDDGILMWWLANHALYDWEPDVEGGGTLAALYGLMKDDAKVGEDE